jgi:hypothetical protein
MSFVAWQATVVRRLMRDTGRIRPDSHASETGWQVGSTSLTAVHRTGIACGCQRCRTSGADSARQPLGVRTPNC